MRIQIFIEGGIGGEKEEILIDRSYLVLNKKAPNIDLQELVDQAYVYLDQQLKDEINHLTQHND